jgi:hypothetical protein
VDDDGFEVAWPVVGTPGCDAEHYGVAVAHDEAPVVVMKCACEQDDFVIAQIHHCMAMVAMLKETYWQSVAEAMQMRGELH